MLLVLEHSRLDPPVGGWSLLCELLRNAPQNLNVHCEAPDLATPDLVLIRKQSLVLPLHVVGTLLVW